MLRSVFLTLFVLMSFCGNANGQSSTRELLSSAAEAFQAERYGEALAQFKSAHSQSEDTRILYNMGRCYEELNQVSLAIDAFQEFLAGQGPQEMKKKALSRLKALQAIPATGSIHVKGNPKGAAVFVDGESVGTLPLVIEKLEVGTYAVVVKAEGYQVFESQVVVTAGGEGIAVVDLRENTTKEAVSMGTEYAPGTTGPRYTELGWGLIGGGGGLVLLGVTMAILGDDYHQQVEESLSKDGQVSSLTSGEVDDLTVKGDTFKISAYLLYGVGGASVVTGLVFLFLDESEVETSTSFGATPLEGGFIWTIGGRF
jgi:hypothetical protein